MSAAEIDEYLRAVDEPKRETLQALRRTILEIVPDAEQGISYRVPRFADCVLGRARHESLAHVELQQAPEGARLVLLDIARVPGEVLLRDRLLGGSEDGLGVKDTAPTVRLGRRGRSRCLARRRSKRRTRLLSRAARRPSEAQQSNRSVMVASAVRLVFCEVKGPGDALRPQQVRKFDAVTRRTSPAAPHARAGSL